MDRSFVDVTVPIEPIEDNLMNKTKVIPLKTSDKWKPLKVDNWGIFLLQRFEQLLRKEELCDLRMSFADSSACIKVHKLVLTSCTEYFESLPVSRSENGCDSIQMPDHFHYSVMDAIVKFMYTGKLQVSEDTFEGMRSTARELKITILIRLLENLESKQNSGNGIVVKVNNGRSMDNLSTTVINPTKKHLPIWKKRKTAPTDFGTPTRRVILTSQVTPKPVRRVHKSCPSRPSSDLPNHDDDEPFGTVFYSATSTKYPSPNGPADHPEKRDPSNNEMFEQLRQPTDGSSQKPNETFEQLRTSASSLKRPASEQLDQQGKKKMNLEELKELMEAQKARTSLSQEDADESCLDDGADDHMDNTPSSDDEEAPSVVKPILKRPSSETLEKKSVRFEGAQMKESTSEDGVQFKKLTSSDVFMKYSKKGVPPSPTAMPVARNKPAVDFSHQTKLIADLIKKNPGLLKDDKPLRLKVLDKSGATQDPSKVITVTVRQKEIEGKKTIQIIHNPSSSPMIEAVPPEGPWVCQKCIKDGNPTKFDSYYACRFHHTAVHQQKFDSNSCEYCGLKSSKRASLVYHMYIEHGISPPKNFSFPKCDQCDFTAVNSTALQKHVKEHNEQDRSFACSLWKGMNSRVKKVNYKAGHGPNHVIGLASQLGTTPARSNGHAAIEPPKNDELVLHHNTDGTLVPQESPSQPTPAAAVSDFVQQHLAYGGDLPMQTGEDFVYAPPQTDGVHMIDPNMQVLNLAVPVSYGDQTQQTFFIVGADGHLREASIVPQPDEMPPPDVGTIVMQSDDQMMADNSLLLQELSIPQQQVIMQPTDSIPFSLGSLQPLPLQPVQIGDQGFQAVEQQELYVMPESKRDDGSVSVM